MKYSGNLLNLALSESFKGTQFLRCSQQHICRLKSINFVGVTRRSRIDESHWLTNWLTESLSVLIDFTDVTLVSDDTYIRLYWYDHDDPDDHDDYNYPDDHDDHNKKVKIVK